MAARCTTPAAAMHHFRGMGAPFRRWRCTIICGQAALFERRTQGGENLKPDRHYEHKQHAFDSYCKKVLKYEAYNGYREISRRQKCEALFSELSEE